MEKAVEKIKEYLDGYRKRNILKTQVEYDLFIAFYVIGGSYAEFFMQNITNIGEFNLYFKEIVEDFKLDLEVNLPSILSKKASEEQQNAIKILVFNYFLHGFVHFLDQVNDEKSLRAKKVVISHFDFKYDKRYDLITEDSVKGAIMVYFNNLINSYHSFSSKIK